MYFMRGPQSPHNKHSLCCRPHCTFSVIWASSMWPQHSGFMIIGIVISSTCTRSNTYISYFVVCYIWYINITKKYRNSMTFKAILIIFFNTSVKNGSKNLQLMGRGYQNVNTKVHCLNSSTKIFYPNNADINFTSSFAFAPHGIY